MNANKIEEMIKSMNKKEAEKSICKYDNLDRLVSQVTTDLITGNNLFSVEMKYLKDTEANTYYRYENNNNIHEETTEYNEFDNPIHKLYTDKNKFDDNDITTIEEFFEYHKDTNLITIAKTYKNGKLSYSEFSEYDDKNRLIHYNRNTDFDHLAGEEYYMYDGDDTTPYKIININNKGASIRETTYNKINDNLSVHESTYTVYDKPEDVK